MTPRTRAEAKATGAEYYETGRACKHGHTSKRFAVNGQCYRCKLDLNAAWSSRNWAGKRAEKVKAYRERRPDMVIAARLKWAAANPGNAAERQRRWLKLNPEKSRARRSLRRARERAAEGSWSPADLAAAAERQGWVCVYCPADLRAGMEPDHI